MLSRSAAALARRSAPPGTVLCRPLLLLVHRDPKDRSPAELPGGWRALHGESLGGCLGMQAGIFQLTSLRLGTACSELLSGRLSPSPWEKKTLTGQSG